MSGTRRVRAGLLAPLLTALLAVAGCSGGQDTPDSGGSSDGPRSGSAAPSASASPGSADGPSAGAGSGSSTPAVRVPRTGSCYRLGYDEAVAPTTAEDPVGCAAQHTAVTYAVGTLDVVVDGHLLAVDSQRVQQQVADTCPDRLPGFLGGDADALRLSMLRSVWYTPTVEESEAGARWFRCDVIAVAADGRLAPLTGPVKGVLGTDRAARYGMCGTAEPGTPGFSRVICSADHSWRAVQVVGLPQGGYPGVDRVRQAGQGPCEDAGREAADDPASFTWGYEWPTREQWEGGQTYGLCWAPD